MDEFIADSMKYAACFVVGLGVLASVIGLAITLPFFFGIFLGGCLAAFAAGAIINTIVILVRKLKWCRQESPSKPQS